MNKKRKNRKYGFMMVEILVAVSIITACVLVAMAVSQRSILLSYRSVHVSQAGFLLEEGAEVIRILRDNDWNNIASLNNSTDYYLEFSGGVWTVNTSYTQIGNFIRKINISDVYRNVSSGNIAEIGILDPNTKLVTVSVSWYEGNNLITKTLPFYIINIFS